MNSASLYSGNGANDVRRSSPKGAESRTARKSLGARKSQTAPGAKFQTAKNRNALFGLRR